MNDTQRLPPLSPAEARQIDQTCDRFEAAWKAGQRPHPEEYLVTAGGSARSALLRQLLLLDWDYRRRAGDDPRAGDYQVRFPGELALIEAVSREMTESPDSTCLGSAGPHARHSPCSGARAPDVPGEAVAATEGGSARYELLQELGQGGIGVVFRGCDRLLGRELAVKVLREDYWDHPDARRRFIEEARVGSQLQHPAIVPVYELGWFSDRRPYFTMKLVEGHTLAALLRDRNDAGQDLPRLLGIFEQVCQAMAYAHAQGVVHRDLKPANVMVGAFGEVQVMDWGFAKVLAGDGAFPGASLPEEGAAGPVQARPVRGRDGVSQSGVLMGTPAYMPPEQARGEAALIDPRADVFALGAILCEILTGRPPYVGGCAAEVCRKATEGELGNAHARLDACGADKALRELARRCLAAERPARPPDAGGVARDLTAYLASAQERLRQAQVERAAAEARAQEAGAKAKAERHARRLSLALAAAAALVLALAGAGWWWHERVQQAQDFRVAATDSKVEAALAEAIDQLHRNDWSRASAAVARARELVESGASDSWKGRVDDVRADLDMLAQIDEIRSLQAVYDYASKRFPREKALPRYAEALARYGIRAGTDPARVAARIMQRPAPVRDALVVGLDNWWLIASSRDDAARDWLGAVLQAVDTDAWRARVRQAVAQRDLRPLEELARKKDVVGQPPATLTALSWALLEWRAYDAVIALLRPAQLRYPNDVWINLDLAHALLLHRVPNHAEALRFFSVARALRPEQKIYFNLGYLLLQQADYDGVVFVSRKVIELTPESDRVGRAEAYANLGIALMRKGEWQQAEAALRKSIELNPDQFQTHFHLGAYFWGRGRVDQAIAAYEQAIRLLAAVEAEAPDSGGMAAHLWTEVAAVYLALGDARFSRKEFDAALAAYDKGIKLMPGYAGAHNARGLVLMKKNRVDEAIAAYEEAIRLDPKMGNAHYNLGNAWQRKGRLDRAIAAYSRAVEVNGDSAEVHYSLGNALLASGDLVGAAAAYGKAIKLDPKFAQVHCYWGLRLREQGRFAEALAALEQGHRLGSRSPTWGEPSAQWLKETQQLVALDAKLPGILDGSEKPATVGEQLEYAWVCYLKGLYGASVRLYADAFRVRPVPASSEQCYRAACVAALAGCGQGKDGSQLDAVERARWRRQTLDWLRADLAFWADRLDVTPHKRPAAQRALQRWQREKALAGIREPEELAKLPESERAGYLRFWADVQELLVRCLPDPPGK
jgi:eukaryotic-like serine/threonine-protein kinase